MGSIPLGIGLYLIPLGMIANPALIGLADSPAAALVAFVKVGLALAAISAGVIRPLPIALRMALVAVGAVVLLIPIPEWG